MILKRIQKNRINNYHKQKIAPEKGAIFLHFGVANPPTRASNR